MSSGLQGTGNPPVPTYPNSAVCLSGATGEKREKMATFRRHAWRHRAYPSTHAGRKRALKDSCPFRLSTGSRSASGHGPIYCQIATVIGPFSAQSRGECVTHSRAKC